MQGTGTSPPQAGPSPQARASSGPWGSHGYKAKARGRCRRPMPASRVSWGLRGREQTL